MTRGICTTNNRFKRSRIFDSKTKIKFHSRTGNNWFTPRIEVWSADRKFWMFVDSHGYEKQLILIWNRVFGHVPTPAKHVLLVHMNMLQGLKIHGRLKIQDVIIHKHVKCVHVNVNHGSLVVWATGHTEVSGSNTWMGTTFAFFWKITRFENCLNFQNARVIIFQKNQLVFRYFPCSSRGRGFDRGTPGPPSIHTTLRTTDVVSCCWKHSKVLCIWSMFHRSILQQWKWMQLNEHWTTRVHKALPAKGIHENLKVCFPNISVQVEFNWYQTSVCWNISILHYRGRKHPKSRVQVHP